MVSPPKPWERTGATAASIASTSPTPSVAGSSSSSMNNPPAQPPPSIPDRPAALASTTPTTAAATATSPYSSPYNRFGSTYGSSSYGGYGTGYGGYSGYGGMGGYNSFGSYGMGGMGSMGGMGYGGMGYGGMGYGGLGGYGGYGAPGGMPGQMQFDPNGNPIPPSLSQQLESTTHTTFALIHSIVQTFTGMAQMLESTFMATHSSFFAMVGVVDQFSQLRNALGSVLGLFGLVRWMKDVVSGRPSHHAMGGEFKDFVQGKPILPLTQQNAQQQQLAKASKKPLIIFLLAIFGIPYAMHKLIRLLASRQPPHPSHPQSLPPLDPSQLQFARALYAFQASNPNELALKENDIVAVIAKLDPRTGMEVDPRVVMRDEGSGEVVEGEWWKGRTREGREGWFPKKWVEVLERRGGSAEEKKVE